MNIRLLIGRFSKIIRGMQNTRARTENPCVGGSIPPSATKNNHLHRAPSTTGPIFGQVSNIQWLETPLILIAMMLIVAILACDDARAADMSKQRRLESVRLAPRADVMRGICEHTVYDVQPGESLCVHVWAPITVNKLAGINLEAVLCDPECDPRALRREPHWSEWDDGNTTRDMHHNVYTASAQYTSRDYRASLRFSAVLNGYSTQWRDGVVSVDACHVRVVRKEGDCE